MKKVIFAFLCCSGVLIACNSGSSGSKSSSDSASTVTSTPEAAAPESKGLELIGASDCTTCHRLHKDSPGATIGPAYSDVAAKYPAAADTTVNRLVHKVISGGSGVWGTVPMTPHAALSAGDVKEMVTYILSLKK